MTNHIEEMMKTAGVEPVYIVKENREDAKMKCTFPTRKDAEYYQNKFGGELIEGFDFTDEKQLEIIKLIVDKCNTLNIFKGFSKDSAYDIGAIEDWGEYKYKSENQDFTQALAQLTTELMKAGKLDKKKSERNFVRMLTFNLKKEWFEKIKSGEKTHEYREIKPYWTRRISKESLLNGTDFKIKFVKGYSNKLENILFAKCKNITYKWGEETDLGISADVYDIEFELIKEQEDAR